MNYIGRRWNHVKSWMLKHTMKDHESKTNVQSCSTFFFFCFATPTSFQKLNLFLQKDVEIEGLSDYPAVNWAKLVLTAHKRWRDQTWKTKTGSNCFVLVPLQCIF